MIMAAFTNVVLFSVVTYVFTCALASPSRRDVIEEIQWADVQVRLGPSHASADHHGHAHTRTNTNQSILTVAMDTTHYQMTLTPTKWLVAPGASIRRVGAGGHASMSYTPLSPRPCLYLASSKKEDGPAGTLSLCHKDGPRILLMTGKEITELLPHQTLPISSSGSSSTLDDLHQLHIYKRGQHPRKTYTHIVKRHPIPAVIDQDCHSLDNCGRSPLIPKPQVIPHISQVMIDPTIDEVKRAGLLTGPLTVELGIFLDQALLDTFSKYLSSDEELVNLVLGLVNNVQSLYLHPSLGREVRLTITHLRLLTVQPDDLPTHRGDRINLLKSFCEYNQRNNDPDDANPEHWDIGIYLSGLNFFEKKDDGTENGVTMGLAYTGGVCKPSLSCVINEFGTVDYRGRPYPSAGALSSYVLAHEIGHSLGLRHDGVSNTCERQGFIMAAGRGLRGATTWSSCARDKLKLQKGICLEDGENNEVSPNPSPWDHSTYEGMPGQRWDATAQCRLFLRDEDAVLYDPSLIHEVCESVKCVTPKRISSYLAGPALEGTHCGGENWCQGGKCVPWGDRPMEVIVGGWGPWSHIPCKSGCVKGATGHKMSRRVCDSPTPKNSVEGCVGVEVVVTLCPDDTICGSGARKTVTEVASELCGRVAKLKKDIEAEGRQMSYSSAPDMSWQACALYCQKINSTSFWTPRYEFKNMPEVPTHLPDGTPCNNGEYVCYNRECVSKESTVANLRGGMRPYRIEEPRRFSPQLGSDYPDLDVDDLFS